MVYIVGVAFYKKPVIDEIPKVVGLPLNPVGNVDKKVTDSIRRCNEDPNTNPDFCDLFLKM